MDYTQEQIEQAINALRAQIKKEKSKLKEKK